MSFVFMIMIVFAIPIVVFTVVMITPVVIITPGVIFMPAVALFVAGIVFLRSDEIDRPIAGVIFMAVFAPVFRMPRRYVQIDYRRRGCLTLDDHGLRIDKRRRTLIADTHLTVNARNNLPGEYDVYIQSVSLANSDCCQQQSGKRDSAHTHSPF